MSNTARRQSITYPNGRVVNLGYGATDSIEDSFSLVKSAAISGESGNMVDYTRVGLARFVKIAYPQPGVEMSMVRPGGSSIGDSGDPYDGFDRFSRVQETRWQNISTGTPIDAWQWGFNEASIRTWKKNLVAASGQDEAYGYDGLHQVIRDALGTLNTNRTAIGGVPTEDEDFTYDPTGNWLAYRKNANGSPVLDQTRSNNKDNQLTQIDGSSQGIEYDRAGNATKIRPGAGGDWTKHFALTCDAWNRLVEVKDENGTSVQKNAYDGLTRRITKEAAGVVTHTYWSDRWKPLEERSGSASTAARSYLWGERPGNRDELILRDRDTDGNGTLDERLYATMDYFNGTAVLNTSGAVQERYAYSAFGVRRIMAADFSPRSSSSYTWEFGFQGQFRDAETGWYNYGYRFYVPLLGRWINRDPIGERGGVNVYRFARNKPNGNVDWLGLKECIVVSLTIKKLDPSGKGSLIPADGRCTPSRNADGNLQADFKVDAQFSKPDCGCCEVRQYLSWTEGAKPFHPGWQDGTDYMPNTPYEDRGPDGRQYGHRTNTPTPLDGYYSQDPTIDGGRPTPNRRSGCGYSAFDNPERGGGRTGGEWKFDVKVIDTCNGGNVVKEESVTVPW